MVSGPAVALESDPAKQPALLKMSRLLCIALYPGNTGCCILCHFKMFLDETVILLLLFPFPSILNGNNLLEEEDIKGVIMDLRCLKMHIRVPFLDVNN